MQLIFEGARNRWEAITKYGEPAADVAKAAGFKWDRCVTRWHHTDALAALRLRDYADKATQAKLDEVAVVAQQMADAKTKMAAEAVIASRAKDAAIELPIAAGRSFLPYQRAGIAYALAHPNVLIGDDMGLGKTLETIGVVNADEDLKKILIVCPASLSRNWVREFGMFGSRKLSIGIASMKALPDTDIVVCTYDVFSRATEASKAILAVTWDCLILDEAHYCKNRDAKRTHVILGGGRPGTADYQRGILVAKRRLYLTGTPITNRPIELWPLVHSLLPTEYKDMMVFAKRYCDAYKGTFGWDFSGASHLDELQDKLRGECLLRRLKTDVLTELPAKRRQIIELPASTPDLRAVLRLEEEAVQRTEADVARLQAAASAASAASADPAAYTRAVAALKAAQQIAFTEMSRVRHLTAIAKAPVVAEHVREAADAGGKIIVFAHHKDVVDHLREALADLGVVSITGDTPPAKRQEAVDAFQGDASIKVFIGNIQAAGVGITLTASSHVVFAELDWVPGNLSQAEDRANRLGQRKSVLVQHLVLEGSIDARMAETVTEKQQTIDAALDTVETTEDREARLAAEQAASDAIVASALAEAKAQAAADEAAAAKRQADREEQESRRAEDRAAVELIRQAEIVRRKAARDAEVTASIEAKAAEIGSANAPTPEATAAIHTCLKVLAYLDPDHAADRNDQGFSATDSYHGHWLVAQDALSPTDALVGRWLCRRYQGQLSRLDAALVSVALGETITARPVAKPRLGAPENAAEPSVLVTDIVEDTTAANDDSPVAIITPEPAAVVPAVADPVRRGQGRPRKETVLSQVERNQRYRLSRELVSLQMPRAIADKLRAAKDKRGLDIEDLLEAALEALRNAEIDAEMAA